MSDIPLEGVRSVICWLNTTEDLGYRDDELDKFIDQYLEFQSQSKVGKSFVSPNYPPLKHYSSSIVRNFNGDVRYYCECGFTAPNEMVMSIHMSGKSLESY